MNEIARKLPWFVWMKTHAGEWIQASIPLKTKKDALKFMRFWKKYSLVKKEWKVEK